MNALVTGASGFIGRVLVEKLLARHGRVRALVRPGSRDAPLRRRGVDLYYGSLEDRESLARSARGVDVVFHAAARVAVWGTRRQFHEANVLGTRHVIEALLASRARRLVHFSSASVYGRQTGVLSEDTPRQRTGDRYSDSKVEAEEVVLEAAEKHCFPLTVLRPALVYGPYDYKYVPTVAANLLKGRMRVVGSGANLAPVVYGEDVADVALCAAATDAAVGRIFNVAGGEPVTWKEFLATLADYLGTRLPRTHLPAPVLYHAAGLLEAVWRLARAEKPPPATRAGVRLLSADCHYDCSHAAAVLGFRPRIHSKEGLRRTVDWMEVEGMLPAGAAGASARRWATGGGLWPGYRGRRPGPTP
jgi:nucleoside-diphosphate-sugar epimerase